MKKAREAKTLLLTTLHGNGSHDCYDKLMSEWNGWVGVEGINYFFVYNFSLAVMLRGVGGNFGRGRKEGRWEGKRGMGHTTFYYHVVELVYKFKLFN
jgi:hypothetical protein